MNYNIFIECYVESKEWYEQKTLFFKTCKNTNSPSTVETFQEMDEQQLIRCGGYAFNEARIHLSAQEFDRYFSTEYSAPQRFAILYGRWMGISKAQEKMLASEDGRRCCFLLLSEYLKELASA